MYLYNADGTTALFLAFRYTHVDTVAALLAGGADPAVVPRWVRNGTLEKNERAQWRSAARVAEHERIKAMIDLLEAAEAPVF